MTEGGGPQISVIYQITLITSKVGEPRRSRSGVARVKAFLLEPELDRRLRHPAPAPGKKHILMLKRGHFHKKFKEIFKKTADYLKLLWE